jgi:hypothetical protein
MMNRRMFVYGIAWMLVCVTGCRMQNHHEGRVLEEVSHPSDMPLSLVRDQKTDYVILLPDDPAPAVATAGRELADYLQKMTGSTRPGSSTATSTTPTPVPIRSPHG